MNRDGSNGVSIFTDGALDRNKLLNAANPHLADFDTRQEADAAAIKAGWQVDNGNHRCPNCKFERWQREGMYIDTRTIQNSLESKREPS